MAAVDSSVINLQGQKRQQLTAMASTAGTEETAVAEVVINGSS